MKDLAYRVVPLVAALPPASASLAGVLVRLDSDDRPYWCDGVTWLDLATPAGNDPRIVTARSAADVSNSTTTLANAIGLLLALAANSTYAIEALVMFQTATTTTGIRLTQTVPAGTSVVAQWNTPTSLTARTLSNQRAADAGATTTGIDTANANTLACGSLLVVTGATAGNLQIRFASETTGANVVVKAGSNLVGNKVS